MTPHALANFLRESLEIEGIHREPTIHELDETEKFIRYDQLTIVRLKALVAVYAPHARLRDKVGLDVYVGNDSPPPGGPDIKERLQHFLDGVNNRLWRAYEAHIIYETLHPFSDGNGRSGRAIWLWQRNGHAPLGFLHQYYYDSLSAAR